MEEHCDTLSQDKLRRMFELVSTKYPDEKRSIVWKSPAFKRSALLFYAKWVALHSVSVIYLEQIKITQKDLYSYLQENPTYEESRTNIKELAKSFLDALKKEQRNLADKEFANAEEIKQLTAQCKAKVDADDKGE